MFRNHGIVTCLPEFLLLPVQGLDERGIVVDHEALSASLKSGRIAGAAVDVFPNEPAGKGPFSSPLQGLPNVILTPHIGGSTEEAQQNIGQFVSSRLIEYVGTGSTALSVNLPNCQLEQSPESHDPGSPQNSQDALVASMQSTSRRPQPQSQPAASPK